jgi:hypothetical protein
MVPQVLEGYMFLGNVEALGGEVQAAFVATLSSSITKVLRGVLLTRPGCEEKAAAAAGLQASAHPCVPPQGGREGRSAREAQLLACRDGSPSSLHPSSLCAGPGHIGITP